MMTALNQGLAQMKRMTVFALALAAGMAAAPARAAEASPSDAMLIMDGSGSMWGVVDGETKIAAARQAVRTLLEAWPADRKLGLMAYGHRRKGDCGDIETIAPVATMDAAAVAAAIDRISPKGKTPIVASLTEAAAQLKSRENAATIILVSDGIETCGGDPCALARELEASGVNFTAHVVGFDVTDPAAKAQLRCIADATGGVYRDAADADGLKEALRETATAEGETQKASAPAPREPEEPYNLRGVARLSTESDPLVGYSTRMAWTVMDPARNNIGGKVGAVLQEQHEPQDVIVSFEYDQVKVEAPAVIKAGEVTTVDLSLNAGIVVSEAAQAGVPGSAAKDWGQLFWQVHPQGDLATQITYSFEPVPSFVLPAGDYTLSVEKGPLAKATRDFSVVAGDELNIGLQLVAGTLRFDAPDSYLVQIARPSDPSDWIASLDKQTGEEAVAPGDYILKVIYREGPDVDTPFTVVEGETVEVKVPRPQAADKER